MRHFSAFVAAGLTASVLTPSLAAQRPRFGAAIGYGLGAADSRTIVASGTDSVTGAGRAGLHLRGFVEFPLTTTGTLSLRTELFYNRLTAKPNSYAIVGSGIAPEALTDRTIGITGSLVAVTSSRAAVAPYFSLGAGIFQSRLGYNPDPSSHVVTRTQGSLGLGVLAGGGLRIRAGRPTLSLDWRYHQALHYKRGSAFMPISLGVTF